MALLNGATREQKLLGGYLDALAGTWRRYAGTWTSMTWVSFANGLAAPVLPLLIMTPKYLAATATSALSCRPQRRSACSRGDQLVLEQLCPAVGVERRGNPGVEMGR